MNPLPENTVGNRIRKKRLEKGISKKDLAEYINSTPKTIDAYEFNRSFPSPKRLVEIATCLDTPLEYFFDEYYEFIFDDYHLKIKDWRKKSNFCLKYAAGLMDISPVTLDRWENEISYPDRISYEKLIEVIKGYPVK